MMIITLVLTRDGEELAQAERNVGKGSLICRSWAAVRIRIIWTKLNHASGRVRLTDV